MNIDPLAEKFMNLSPYQYAANNPVFFIDVNGEYIYVTDPDTNEKYRYQNGQTQHQVDGKWTAIDASVILSSFVLNTIAGINGLEASGKTGAGLVSKFSGESKDVNFQYRAVSGGKGNEAVFAGQQGLSENTIYFDDKYQQKSFTTLGYIANDAFITIGHEMAHLTGSRYGSPWYNQPSAENPDGLPSDSEIRATHYENMIRAESGRPLRTHYGEYMSNGVLKPDARSTLIDKQGNSVYYNSATQRYPGQVVPTLINQGINANNGRILNDRYNYNGN